MKISFLFLILKFYNYSLEELKMIDFLYFWGLKSHSIVEECQMLEVDLPTLHKCLIVYLGEEGWAWGGNGGRARLSEHNYLFVCFFPTWKQLKR